MLTQQDLQKQIQQQVLAAVWQHNDAKLTQLLATADALPATIALRSRHPQLAEPANILEIAFLRANKTAIVQLINCFREHKDFSALIVAACKWLPPVIAEGLSNCLASAQANEYFGKLLEFYMAKTTMSARLSKIKQELKLINDSSHCSLEEKTKKFFPTHYAVCRANANAFTHKNNIEHLEYILALKQTTMEEFYGLYQKTIADFASPQDDPDFLTKFYFTLKKSEFETKALFAQSTCFVQKTLLGAGVMRSSPLPLLQKEMQDFFATDLNFLVDMIKPLASCLEPKFIAYMQNADFEIINDGEYKYEVGTRVHLRKYSEEIDAILKEIDGLLKQDCYIPLWLRNNLQNDSLRLQCKMLDYSQARQALAQEHAKNHTMFSTDSTREAFYALYDFKQEAIAILERLLAQQVQLDSRHATAPAAKDFTTAKEENLPTPVTAATITAKAEAAATPTARAATSPTPEPAPPMPAATTAKTPAPEATPVLRATPARRSAATLPTNAEPLTAEEFNSLKKMQLSQYKDEINNYRAGRNQAELAHRAAARQSLLAAIRSSNNDNDRFEEEFKQYISKARVDRKLVEQTDAFLADQKPVLYSDLSALLQRLGFTERPTTQGFCFQYKNFSVSGHRAHKGTGNSFAVDPQPVSILKKAMRENHVIEHLRKRFAAS